MTMTGSDVSRRLAHGVFFGNASISRDVSGLSMAVLTPVVPSDEVERHTHESAHFIVLIAGRYISTAAGAPAVCDAPFVIYNPPGTEHRDRFHSPHGRFITVSITADRWADASEQLRLPQDPTALTDIRSTATAMRLFKSLGEADTAAVLDSEALALSLLGCATATDDRIAPRPVWVERARELLHDRCAEAIRLNEVAAELGIHPVHLARYFRRFLGQSPGEYLRACRMKRAMNLLTHSHMPLVDVSLECGFSDQSHFSKAFGQSFGLSPRHFRKNFARNLD
jgi:AraC family transcriptional regulator